MPASSSRFRLTATTVAGHFKYRCDRRFRWTAVPNDLKGVIGTPGEAVERAPDQGTRPGIKELMQGGDRYEVGEVQRLVEAHGDAVAWSGVEYDARKGGDTVAVLPFDRFLDVLRAPDGVRYIAQADIGYDARTLGRTPTDDEQRINEALNRAFCARFGLNPAHVELGRSRPDLLELVPSDTPDDLRPRLRVWDFKSSRAPRHEHYVQVAWYTYVLEAVLEVCGIDAVRVDTKMGAVQTHARVRESGGAFREAEPRFDLGPYRREVAHFLRAQAPRLLAVDPTEAHWHVCGACLSCEYLQPCRESANTTRDISRVPYLTSESRRRLVAEGLRTHHDLAALADRVDAGDAEAQAVAARLRALSHDLNLNLGHYLGAAQALGDADDALDDLDLDGRAEGERRIAAAQTERWRNRPTIRMPQYETVRIVLAAEQDAVTHRCFALGFRQFFWDDDTGSPEDERVFVSRVKPGPDAPDGDEGDLLDAFLEALFERLRTHDAHNRAVNETPIPEDDALAEARTAFDALWSERRRHEADIEALKGRRDAEAKELRRAANDALERIGKTTRGPLYEAKVAKDQAWRACERIRRPKRRSVQIYVYDALDLSILREAIERHLFDPDTPPERFARLRDVARLVPPSSMLPSPSTFRTMPVTVVQDVLRECVSLPVPYLYDLRTVTHRLRGLRETGALTGHAFRPPYGFHWQPSNQIAFERIHDVWNGQDFVHPAPRAEPGPVRSRTGEVCEGVTVEETPSGKRVRRYTPAAIYRQIEETLRDKLRATDGVVRVLRERLNARKMTGEPYAPGEKEAMRARGEWPKTLLPFPKEPFYLSDVFDPAPALDASTDRLFEALDTFTILEESVGELQLKQSHTAQAEERAARFEAIAGLVFEREENGTLVFLAPPEARDSKRTPGDLNLVLTNADDLVQLLADVDGELFRNAQSPRGGHAKVEFLRAEPCDEGVRVWLKPQNRKGFDAKVNLARPCVLDEAYADFNSPKTLEALRRLRRGTPGDGADHIRAFVRTGTMAEYRPFLRDADARYAELSRTAAPGRDLLNEMQHRAFRMAFDQPVSLVWGPPGTGKTHTVARTLVALARAAQVAGRPLRVLVTAQSHHAIANVLKAVARAAEQHAVAGLDVVKVISSYGPNAADQDLPDSVRWAFDSDKGGKGGAGRAVPLTPLLGELEHDGGVHVVGATVWAAHKMAKAWRAAHASAPPEPVPSAADETPDEDAAESIEYDGPPVVPLFDLVLVDEASQLKVADALIALSTLRPGGSIVLAGDDRQLPPIVRGTYPEGSEPFLTSVFAFARHRLEERMEQARDAARSAGTDPEAAAGEVEAATLVMLSDNFRMNAPLTAYPRDVLYPGFTATRPGIRLDLEPPAPDDDPLTTALLDPDRPVVLVRYASPETYTARNPLEADLAVRIVETLARRLRRPDGTPYHAAVATLAATPPGAEFAAEGAAVIAPHRAQNATIRARLRERGFAPLDRQRDDDAPDAETRVMPLVDTVDKAQGQEFDAVVVSYGVADEAYAEAESAFLLSRNRFNVAVTRARKKVIVLVSDAVLHVVPTDRQVLLDATMLKAFEDYCSTGAEAHLVRTPDGHDVMLHVHWRGFDPPVES